MALIDYGVDPTLDDNICIKWACVFGWGDLLSLLLKNEHVDIAAEELACVKDVLKHGHLHLLELLAADERYPATGFFEALDAAVNSNDLELVDIILNNRLFNHADEDALGFRTAAEFGLVEHVRRGLTSPFIDPGILENEAVRLAAFQGHAETVRLLMSDPRIDPSDCDNEALIEAAKLGLLDVVTVLLEDERVNPSCRNFEALHVSARAGSREMFDLLSQNCDMMQMVQLFQATTRP